MPILFETLFQLFEDKSLKRKHHIKGWGFDLADILMLES